MRTCIAAVLAIALAACSPASPAARRDAPQEPALWHVHDADSDIWLFGTAHELPPGVQWRSARVDAAFAAADEIVTETDASPPAIAEYQRLASQLGTLPAGQTLFTRLSAEDRARLDRVARSAGLQPEQFTQVRPWLVALQLSFAHETQRGQQREHGVETVLVGDADAQRKRHTFLETPSQQVHFLSDLAPADEVQFLSATLHQIEGESANSGGDDALDVAWAHGDIDALSRTLDAQMREAGPAAYAALITNRNRAWAEEIEQRLRGSGKIFVAVGAQHLIGPGSVVDLLRQRGIAVDGP